MNEMSGRNYGPRGRRAGIWLSAILFASAASGAPAQPVSLDPLLESVRASKPVPALAAAVVHRGETVAIGAVGFRKDGSPERVTRNDRWHIGSCTKSMTAVLAAMLDEEDRMRWDTTLPEMFPALASEMNAEWRGVTLEQLLAVVVCTNLGGDTTFQAVDLAAARLIQEFLTGPERDG